MNKNQHRIKPIGLVILLTLLSCGGTGTSVKLTKHCKAAMEELVPTPSTIEFIKQRYRYTPEEIEVTVQFDAQNIYGAKIRHKLKCTYLERKKGVVKASKIELDHETLSELGLAVTNTAIYLKHRYEFD